MNIEDLQKKIRHYLTLFKANRTPSRPRVYRHWEMVLVSFSILNILLIGFSVYLFLQVSEGDIFLVEQSQEVRIDTIDRTLLEELLVSFEIKEALFEDRQITPPRIPNPSL